MKDDEYEEVKNYFVMCDSLEEAKKLLEDFPEFERHLNPQFRQIDERKKTI